MVQKLETRSLGEVEDVDAAIHPPQLEPRPPIMADQAGEATNWTPATKQYT